MNGFQAGVDPDGGVVFDTLPTWLVAVLRDLPRHLSPDPSPAARERLFPPPSDDADHREEWRRVVEPDLFALIASARQIVEADLRGMTLPTTPRGTWTLKIPAAHVDGWVSALNTARLTLGAEYAMTQDDLESDEPPDSDERGTALGKIQLFGLLQHLLIDAVLARLNPDTEPD